MNLVRRIGIVMAIILLLFVGIGVFLPSKRHLERSITINTPASVVFEEVNNFQRWSNWSPWYKLDPTTKFKYKGPEAGVGSTMMWSSKDRKVGKGSQKIVVSEPNQHMLIDLHFEGFKGTVTAGWKFEELQEGKTLVTWSNDSNNKGGLFAKYLDILIQAKVCKSYEQGLQNLKKHVENLYIQQQATPEEDEDQEEEETLEDQAA